MRKISTQLNIRLIAMLLTLIGLNQAWATSTTLQRGQRSRLFTIARSRMNQSLTPCTDTSGRPSPDGSPRGCNEFASSPRISRPSA